MVSSWIHFPWATTGTSGHFLLWGEWSRFTNAYCQFIPILGSCPWVCLQGLPISPPHKKKWKQSKTTTKPCLVHNRLSENIWFFLNWLNQDFKRNANKHRNVPYENEPKPKPFSSTSDAVIGWWHAILTYWHLLLCSPTLWSISHQTPFSLFHSALYSGGADSWRLGFLGSRVCWLSLASINGRHCRETRGWKAGKFRALAPPLSLSPQCLCQQVYLLLWLHL